MHVIIPSTFFHFSDYFNNFIMCIDTPVNHFLPYGILKKISQVLWIWSTTTTNDTGQSVNNFFFKFRFDVIFSFYNTADKKQTNSTLAICYWMNREKCQNKKIMKFLNKNAHDVKSNKMTPCSSRTSFPNFYFDACSARSVSLLVKITMWNELSKRFYICGRNVNQIVLSNRTLYTTFTFAWYVAGGCKPIFLCTYVNTKFLTERIWDLNECAPCCEFRSTVDFGRWSQHVSLSEHTHICEKYPCEV